MPGIRGLHVDANTYTGEINVHSELPEVHVLLCSDTLFLDRAMSAMAYSLDFFELDGKGKVCLLRKQDTLVEGLTVAENLFLQLHDTVFLSKKKMEKTCDAVFAEFGYYLPSNALVSSLTVSQRRFVEFYRVYLREPEILVANEVTSNLSYKEIVYFNHIISKMKKKGTTVFLLTTRCEEAVKVGDIFHVYVSGEEKKVLTKEEVLGNSQELYALLLDIDPNQPETDEQREQQQWMKIISESIHIENRFARINAVLSAYCDRLRNLMNGQFCRLYLYQASREQLICIAGNSDGQQGCGRMNEKDIRMIINTSTLFASNEREPGYTELFETDTYPKGLICYTLKSEEDNWVFIEIGVSSLSRYMKNNKVDMLQYIAIELLIFIENNRLWNQTVILQESNHRIKNNMQMILSYLMLQRQSLQEKLSGEDDWEMVDLAFEDLTNRIMAVYNVHNLLSSEENLQDTIDLTELLNELNRIYADYLELEEELEDIPFPRKMLLSLCIIFNEMMNNTVKHNAYSKRKRKVRIQIWQEAGQVHIFYRDDGKGQTEDATASSGIGMRLIKLTVQNDLKGELTIDTKQGYQVSIVFPEKSLERSHHGLGYIQ